MITFEQELAELTNHSSKLFSSLRHHERESNKSKTKTKDNEPIHILQLDQIINRNTDAVLSQAKVLLDEWMTGKETVPLDDGFDYYEKWINKPIENEENVQKEARNLIDRSFSTNEKVVRKCGSELSTKMRMRQQLAKEKRDLLEQEKRLENVKKKYGPKNGDCRVNHSGYTPSTLKRLIHNNNQDLHLSQLTSNVTFQDNKTIAKSKPIRKNLKAQNDIAIKILSEELSRELCTINSETEITTKEAVLNFKKQQLLSHQLKAQAEEERISSENKKMKLKIAYQKSDQLYNSKCLLKKQKVFNILLSIVKTSRFENEKLAIRRQFCANRNFFRKWRDICQKRVKKRELEFLHEQMLMEQQNMNKAVRFERLGLLKLFRTWRQADEFFRKMLEDRKKKMDSFVAQLEMKHESNFNKGNINETKSQSDTTQFIKNEKSCLENGQKSSPVKIKKSKDRELVEKMEKREQDRQARKKLLIEQKLLKEKALKESVEKAKIEKELFEKEQLEKERLAIKIKTREILLKKQKLKEELERKINVADLFYSNRMLKGCYWKISKKCQTTELNFKKSLQFPLIFIYNRIRRAYIRRTQKVDHTILSFQSSQLIRSYFHKLKLMRLSKNVKYQISDDMNIKRILKSFYVALLLKHSINNTAKLHHKCKTSLLIFHKMFKVYKIRVEQRAIKDKINNRKADAYFQTYAPRLVWRNWINFVNDQKEERFREHKRERLRLLAKAF